MKSVMISAPFFSKNQIKKVKLVENALKQNPTVGSVYSPRLHQTGDGYPEFSHKWCEATYKHDLQGVLNHDVTVEILDFDNDDADSGTAFEFGYGVAHHKFMTAISLDHYSINLMLGIGADYYFKDLNDLKHYNFNKRLTNTFNGKMH